MEEVATSLTHPTSVSMGMNMRLLEEINLVVVILNKTNNMEITMKHYESGKGYFKQFNPKSIGVKVCLIDDEEMVLVGIDSIYDKPPCGDVMPTNYKVTYNTYGYTFYWKAHKAGGE